MTLIVRVKPGDHRVVTNEATVASDVLDPDTSNNTATATTFVRIADLAIAKTSDADAYKPSSQITYTIAVTNKGPGNAENVVVTDVLPLSANDRVAVLDPACTLAATTATCNLGTIAPLGSRTVTIAIVLKGKSGFVSNTATVSSTTSTPTRPTTPRPGSLSPAVRRSPRANRRGRRPAHRPGAVRSRSCFRRKATAATAAEHR